MGRADTSVESKSVDFELVASALAKAIYEGDFVNFRLIFAPFSPARTFSTENFDMPKYEYLLPDEEVSEERAYKDCLAEVRRLETKTHILRELDAKRPPQMPSNLLLMLADNAVRHGKYSSAAQAYEVLRIRAQMQNEFLEQADAALDKGDVATGAKGYAVATGLAYDYAAFPEPLPLTPDFQTRALMMHAEYPQTLAECVGMWDAEKLVKTALVYLLAGADMAARLDSRPLDFRVIFLKELVRHRDPLWAEFIEHYAAAGSVLKRFADRLRELEAEQTLAQQIEAQLGEDPREISAALLGRTIQDGEWWQYLKELAYEHPAAALFVARQAVGDLEILIPRHAPGSPVAKALGLPDDAVVHSASKGDDVVKA